MRVALLVTCVVDVLAPEVGEATVHVLRRAGHDVSFDPGQTCCGQPAWNAGHAEEAATVARTTLAALERELDAGAEAVVVPAGSCAAMVRLGWPSLGLDGAERVAAATHELTAFLAEHGAPAPEQPSGERVAWHHACHAMRELHLADDDVDTVLRAAGVERVAWPDGGGERCCGFGGLFSAVLPEVACAMADEKLSSLPACDIVASADSSCLLHLRSRARATGRQITTKHVSEVLDHRAPHDGASASEPGVDGRGAQPHRMD